MGYPLISGICALIENEIVLLKCHTEGICDHFVRNTYIRMKDASLTTSLTFTMTALLNKLNVDSRPCFHAEVQK